MTDASSDTPSNEASDRPFDAPNQTEYDTGLIDTERLRDHLAAEHGVDPEDVFIRALTADRVYYALGTD